MLFFTTCNFSRNFSLQFPSFPSPDQLLHSASPRLPILPPPHSTHLSSRSAPTITHERRLHQPLPHLGAPTHWIPPCPQTCTVLSPHPRPLAGSPHAAARRHPGSARPPPGAAVPLCAEREAARTPAIYTWLKQIPRWLRSFPCILFSLPGPRGHFPFPPAFPLRSLPVRLTPALLRRAAPSPRPPQPAPLQPLALPHSRHRLRFAVCTGLCPAAARSVASGGQLKRQSAKSWGAPAAKPDKTPEKSALLPAGACDGIENPLYASVGTTRGGKKLSGDMMRQQRGKMWD